MVSALAALVSACFMSAQEFFKLTLPLSAVSFLVLTLGTLIVKPYAVELRFAYRARIGSKMQLVLFAGLFCLCIASVLGSLHYLVTTAVVMLSVFTQEKAALLIGTNLGGLGNPFVFALRYPHSPRKAVISCSATAAKRVL